MNTRAYYRTANVFRMLNFNPKMEKSAQTIVFQGYNIQKDGRIFRLSTPLSLSFQGAPQSSISQDEKCVPLSGKRVFNSGHRVPYSRIRAPHSRNRVTNSGKRVSYFGRSAMTFFSDFFFVPLNTFTYICTYMIHMRTYVYFRVLKSTDYYLCIFFQNLWPLFSLSIYFVVD